MKQENIFTPNYDVMSDIFLNLYKYFRETCSVGVCGAISNNLITVNSSLDG